MAPSRPKTRPNAQTKPSKPRTGSRTGPRTTAPASKPAASKPAASTPPSSLRKKPPTKPTTRQGAKRAGKPVAKQSAVQASPPPLGRRVAPRLQRTTFDRLPLLLVIDVGNTQSILGLYEGGELRWKFRVSSGIPRSGDELRVLVAHMVDPYAKPLRERGRAVLSSVVPTLTGAYLELAESLLPRPPILVNAETVRGLLEVDVPDPMSVGGDRLANALGIGDNGTLPAIVVDLGTTTNFDVVLPGPRYIGGAIAPGIVTSSEELFRRGARLAKVEIVRPPRALGRTTAECLQSGVYFGAIGQIDEIVRRLCAELRIKARVVATGGLSSLIAPESSTIGRVEPDLTLEGLRVLGHARMGT